jgi:hypothetical protein
MYWQAMQVTKNCLAQQPLGYMLKMPFFSTAQNLKQLVYVN